MLESRRRHAGSSTGTNTSHSVDNSMKRAGTSHRSASSGSITPMEEEDDTPRRSTRGTNPLPKQKGPLFPPLPPKVPKVKASPKVSVSRTPSAKPPEGIHDPQAEIDAEPAVRRPDGVRSRASTPDAEKPSYPSGSGTSLTPPPPSSDDPRDPDQANGLGANGGTAAEGSRRRGQRGSFVPVPDADEEEEDGEDDQETPGKTRPVIRARPSGGNTPTGSAGSDKGSKAAGNRRRRGEEQLLLDDHLLPEEMRRTGRLTGKRGRDGESLVHGKKDVKEEHEPGVEAEQEVEVAESEVSAQKEDEGEVVGEEEEKPQLPGTDQTDDGGLTQDDDEQEEEEDEDDEEDADGDEVTRCVCGQDDGDDLMVACDKCNVWQHGPCVGIWTQDEAPDEYFCEQCRPELHGPLRKWIRSKGRNIALFIPPTPEDLERLHSPHDKYPTSQSKRWLKSAASHPNKPPSRSKGHDGSPVEPNDTRRSSRREAPPPPPPPVISKRRSLPVLEQREIQKPPSHRRKASIEDESPMRDSRSPTATAREPKKRSTMNSRDAAFEEEVQAAIEASRREMGDTREDEDLEGEEEHELAQAPKGADVPQEKGKEEVEKEKDAGDKGKRKREDGNDSVEPSAPPSSQPGKVKHPNQYTYRPKPVSSSTQAIPSPVRRGHQGGTPAPPVVVVAPALHEHGTRRAGALANGAREAPFVAVPVTNIGWHLPEHLSAFSDLLPTSNPTPLSVRSPRQLPAISKNHFHNLHYGPFSEERDETGKLLLGDDPPEREAMGSKGETHSEPPARVKFPQRRITTAEMRKRVRHMLEFCGRVEVEEKRRGERKGRIGIPDADRSEVGGADTAAGPKVEGSSARLASRDRRSQSPLPTDAGAPAESQDLPARPTNDRLAPRLNGHHASGGSRSPFGRRTPSPAAGLPTDDTEPHVSTSTGPSAAHLLAELTADLIEFQEIWARGGFLQSTAASPVMASSATGTGSGSGSGGGTGNEDGYGNGGGFGTGDSSGHGRGSSPVVSSGGLAPGGWPTSGLAKELLVTREGEGGNEGVLVGEETGGGPHSHIPPGEAEGESQVAGGLTEDISGGMKDSGTASELGIGGNVEEGLTGLGILNPDKSRVDGIGPSPATGTVDPNASLPTVSDALKGSPKMADTSAAPSPSDPPPGPTAAADTAGASETSGKLDVELAPEAVDVYREGKVQVVVADQAEEAAARAIEQAAEHEFVLEEAKVAGVLDGAEQPALSEGDAAGGAEKAQAAGDGEDVIMS